MDTKSICEKCEFKEKCKTSDKALNRAKLLALFAISYVLLAEFLSDRCFLFFK